MSNYTGTTPDHINGAIPDRYFYGLRRTDNGELFVSKIDVNHDLVYKNLNYEQMRWDSRNISYYVDSDGELVARVNHSFTYDDNSSSNGL